MAPLRVFLAVDLPEGIRRKLFSLAQGIDKEGVVPVEEQNLHVTLKFFGDMGYDKITAMESKLRDVRSQPLKVSVKGVGVFPSEEYIRVVWAGCTGLEPLVKRIDDALGGQFEQSKEERFQGHVTIARVKRKADLRDFLSAHKSDVFGDFTADRFELKSSQLTRMGPVYSTVSEFGLQ